MKKLMTLILALTLVCSLAACGQKESGGDCDKNTAIGNGNIAGGGEVTMDCEYLYGKVTNIVGNEIEVAIAEMPEMDAPDVGGTEDDGMADIPDGGVAAAPASPVDPISDDVGANMEYTGETLTITIPAGTKIYSMGQETTLSSLKKGSIVSLVVDNLDDMNLVVVDIMA